MKSYHLTRKSLINNNVEHAGTIVTLPDDVIPGAHMVPVDQAELAKRDAAVSASLDEKAAVAKKEASEAADKAAKSAKERVDASAAAVAAEKSPLTKDQEKARIAEDEARTHQEVHADIDEPGHSA